MSDSSYKSQVAATWGFTRQATCTPCWKFVETFLFFTTLSFQRVLLIRVEKKEILQSCILFFVPRNKRSMSATWCTSGHLMLGRGGACLYTHSSGKTSQTPRSGVHSISARIRFVCCMNVGSTGPCVPLDFRRGMREAWTADTELWDPFHRLRKV